MDDKMLLEELLCYEKNLCDIYLHATIESSNKNMYDAFSKNLNESLASQHNVYKIMEEAGYYTVSNAEEKNITKAKKKFNCN